MGTRGLDRLLPGAVIALLVGACLAWQAARPGTVRAAERALVAVLNLDQVSATPAQASALSDRLREVLLKTGRFTVVDRSQIEAVLNEQALQQTGCTEQECAVQVGRILGVRKIVAGRVTRVDDRLWLVSAIMVDVETAETVRAESVRHAGTYFELLEGGMVQLGNRLADTALTAAAGAPTAAAAGEMVRVPAGEFVMGFDGGFFHPDDQKPPHPVLLSAFRIDRTEVTQADYERVMGSNPSRYPFPGNPVEAVTWEQAEDYCRKVGKRLPTEAEWERAARAGSAGPYWWGDATDDETLVRRANYDQPVNQRLQDGYTFTAPVGRFEPNPLGLLDAYGNVAEWVADWYAPYPAHRLENPTGPATGSHKVVRGGSWRDKAKFLGATVRDRLQPGEAKDFVGFRCAASG